MTAEFPHGNGSEKKDGQTVNGGPSRIEAPQPTFFTGLDALQYAKDFSDMEVDP